jgi:hypothetical protein
MKQSQSGTACPVKTSQHGGKHMITNLSTGDSIHIGDSITLTVLAIEGDVVRFGIEYAGPHGPEVLIEGSAESGLHWWDLN